jgi:hypothetical protein
LGESRITYYLSYITTYIPTMKKNKLKALIKEAFLIEGKTTLLNENAPGFDNRKQGGPLPTLEGIKAAYEAKNGKEAVNEDEFTPYDTLIGPVIAGMVEIRKYVENVAPEHLEAFEMADRALTAFNEKMAYGDGDDLGVPGDNALGLEENIKKADAIIAESKMEKELNYIYAREREYKERMRIANELFPEIAKEQEGGKLVNFKPLSQKQRDEVYDNLNEETLPDEGTKITSDGESLIKLIGKQTSILQKLKLINNRKELEDVLDYILTQVNPNLSLNQASVKAAAMSSIKKASATNEAIITEADMIAESFRKAKK